MQIHSRHTFLKSWLGKNWWASLIIVDVVLLAFTIGNPYISDFQHRWRLVTPFSLHTENNFAVWWSGITLLLAAILAYQRSLNDNHENKLAWLVLAILLAGLSLDEIGSFHERIGHAKGWPGILPFGVLVLVMFAYANIKLFQSQRTTTNAKYLCIAIALFFSVVLQEYLEHNYAWKPWMLGLRVGLEEGTELLATLFTLLAIIYRKDQKLNIFSLLPQSNSLANLRWIAVIGLITHIIGCYLIVRFGDPFFRGNPMDWYPTAIYFCIALVCAYKVIAPKNQIDRNKWGILTVLAIVTSVAIMTNLFMIVLPGAGKIIDPAIISEHFLLIYLVQLLCFSILLRKSIQTSLTRIAVSIIFISVLIWIDLSSENIWLRYSILGALSYWTFYIFTSKNLLES